MKSIIAGFFLSVPALLAPAPAANARHATLAEGFEGATFPPAGWTTQSAGLPGPHAWHRTTDPDDIATGHAAAYVGSGSPSAIDEWLITPVVSLGATDKAIKFYWSGNTQWSSVLDGSLNIREVGTTSWTSLWSIAGNESPADPFIYRERFVDLSKWTGKKVQLAFRVVGKNGASFGLDDIAVGAFAPSDEHELLSATKCGASRNRSSANPWQVVALREPWANDIPFETRTDYLRSSSDRNNMPGPDSLVARVAIVARRGYVEILNTRTGKSRRLLETPAFLPQWSPDGSLISCGARTPETHAGKLTVVDVTTSKVVLESELAQASESKWSPDSHVIAASGITNKGNAALLYTITVPDARLTVIDSLKVLTTHEFSWSPDGRWIAFSRPTRLDHLEDVIAADLWIADAATGDSWCLLNGSEWAVSDPLWITNRSIQITRVRWHDEGDNEEQRLVVELSHSADLPKHH